MNDAIARHRKMVEQFPDHELARFSLGKSLFDAEQYAEALEHLGVAVRLRPDWMAAQILRGRCELYLGKTEAAKETLLRAHALAKAQNHATPLAETAQLLEDLGVKVDEE
jgi:tetratricopeptide (TPR) repeat protein